MNSRVLCSIWRLNSLRFIRKQPQIATTGYAIPTAQHILCPAFPQLRRSYTIRAAVKENINTLEQALSKLQNDFSAHGNIHPGNYQKLIECLDSGGSLSDEHSVFLLEVCADLMPSQSSDSRMELFQKLWDHLKANGGLKKQHYISYLKVYAANGVALSDFRKFIAESRVADDPEMYEKLVQYSCELGDVKLTSEILSEMRDKGFPLTENVFNALILGNSRNNDLKAAYAVLETMNAAGVKHSSSTYTNLIAAYIEHNDLEKATDVIQQNAGQFTPIQIVSLMKILAKVTQGDCQKVMGLLVRQLPADFLNAKEVPSLIRNLCTELIFTGRVDEATTIMNALPSPKFNDNQDVDTFGVSFLQDLFRSKVGHQKIIDIAKMFMESGKNSRALHIACDSASRRNPDHGIFYLEALSASEPLRPHYFWPLILHKFRSRGEAGILKALKTMSSLGVNCDFETLSFYVLPRLSVTLDNTKQAIKTLEDCGLKTSQTLTPIIAHLIFQQKLEDVVNIAQLYTSKQDVQQFINPLANTAVTIRATRRYQKYTSAIHALHLKSDNPKVDFVGQVLLEIIAIYKLRNDSVMLSRIISDLSRLGTRISPAAVELLVGHLSTIKNDKVDIENIKKMLSMMVDRTLSLPISEKSGSHISHPRDMSYEELECHLVELEAKEMNTRGVLRRLLQICVKDGHLERALEIKKRCDEANVEVSAGMLASIFDMYIKLGDLPAAEASHTKLSKTFPGFLLDEHKLIDFAALMVQTNKLEEAKNLLTERAASRKVYGGDYVIKNVWNLLNNIARVASQQPDLPKDKNLTKEFFFFLKKLGYCSSHNAVLGPIIREYIYRKDIRSAVAEFKVLAETFRHTPLQFELASLLVRLSNSEDHENYNITQDEAKQLLQLITAVNSSVHGQVNTNSSLLMAVAESGTENQLRKLLINPEFRINQEMLTQNCEYLNEEGSIKTLMKLAKACRGLGHVINEQSVYNMLLMKFSKENNCTASLQLFEQLEADDELKISQEFLKNLVNLLKINNVEVPSSLALRAQVM